MTDSQIGTTWLLVAIATDVLSTIYMAKANGFSNIPALLFGAALYIISFITCVLALKYMQAGMLYVLWAGIGTLATAMLAKMTLNQTIDLHGWIGIAFIVVGLTYIAKFSTMDV